MRYIIFLLLFCLAYVHCAEEQLDININNSNQPTIPDTEDFFVLVHQNTDKIVGFSYRKVTHYKTAGRLFYDYIEDFHLKLKYEDNNEILRVHSKAHSKVDRNFRIRSFRMDHRINDKRKKHSGFMGKKYIYIKELAKSGTIEYRIRMSKPIYSDLVEIYLLQNELKQKGDATTFHFMNLKSMEIEEERIIFEDDPTIEIFRKEIPSYHYITNNYTSGESNKFWFDRNYRLIRRTSYQDSIRWESRSLDEKKSFDFEYSTQY